MSLLEDTPERFQAELEFINALSSPDFLLHLAHQRHLESEGFLRFESLSVPNDNDSLSYSLRLFARSTIVMRQVP